MAHQVRKQPCQVCPYRKDCPSGVWSVEDYTKLPPYDAPTAEQPFAPFMCHATPEYFCNGWAICHTRRDHAHDLLALRFYPVKIPEPKVALFTSGTEAAKHGLRDINKPKKAARRAMDKLTSRYERLRKLNEDTNG